MNSSDSSSSECNFNNNNNNNSSKNKPASLNKTKHSISMFQIQQLLEIRTDQKLIDNEEDNISSLTTTTTTSSKRTFVRNTAGSFDLNVNNLNLNESSKSNSKLIIEQQQQNDFNKLPVDSAQALACSALNTNCLLGRAATTPVRSRSPNLRSNSSLNVLPVSNNNIINKSSNQSETDYFKNNEIKSNSKLFTFSTSESALKYQDKLNLYNEIQNTTIYNKEQEQNEQFKPINVIKSLDLNHVISLTDLNLLATNDDNKKTFNSLDLTDEIYENNNNNNNNEYDSNKNAKIKKQKKSSAFAWMGRTVGKKINKHQNFNSHHHHHVRKLTSSPNTTITTTTTTTDSNHPSSSSSLNIKSDNNSNNNNDSILIASTSNASESMASATVLSTPTSTNTTTNVANSANKSNKKLIRIDWTVKFILVLNLF
jgi:hypothetical protein